MNANPSAIANLPADLPALDWVTDPARVARLSQDFAWFSPVLKRQLADKTAEIAVRPRTEAEVAAVVGACARHGIPITVRGSGTGNYGQAIPLHGGLILDMSGYNGFGWARGGVGRAQAGIRLADFDRQARPQGWELRWLPSTFRSATLGGLFGGGFGGAGSITYGPVAAAGNVLGVRAMTVEPEPQLIELRSPEAMLMHHTYGTNGIVLELEVALAPALDWVESIAVFTAFDAALEFASALSCAPGLVKKEVCFLGAPVPDHMAALAEHLPSGCHAVLIVMAASSQDGMQDLLAAAGGTLSYCKTAAESGSRTLLEYTWNHTTLVAMKVDRGLTYIQSAFEPARHVEQVKALEKALGGEVLMHLEFLRTKEGAVTCSGLQLIRYSDDARLDEIMQIHREHGATINNPHVYILEDGKQGKLNPAAVELKRRFDPMGLLNPGKMRSWATAASARTERVTSA
jgi:FAD/FMN-containing dehydrogenase